jgi:flagellar protein FlaG
MNIESIQTASQAPQSSARGSPPSPLSESTKLSAPTTEALKASAPNTSEQQSEKPSIKEAVQRLSEFVASTRSEINFEIDEASGVQVVKVLDSESGDIIRQFPSEEAIQLAQVLDKLQGLLVKDKA